MSDSDSAAFRDRKAFFQQIITVYGRKPVLEAMLDEDLRCYRLHLADSNKPAPILTQMETLARQRKIEVCYHGKRELSRISRNGKQDQGVAADILCPAFRTLDQYLAEPAPAAPRRLLACCRAMRPPLTLAALRAHRRRLPPPARTCRTRRLRA